MLLVLCAWVHLLQQHAWLLAKLALDKSLRGDKDHQWGGRSFTEICVTTSPSENITSPVPLHVVAAPQGKVE